MATFQPKAPDTGPHPRREPRYDRPLTLENLEAVFQGCADFMKREVYLHGDRERMVTICYLLGMTRNERLSDYILRPLAQDDALSRVPMDEVFKRLRYGALYNLAALVRETLDILCTAKSFGGGMPLGAFISSDGIMSTLKTNPVLGHITTFGGHPVCCAAGLAALEYLLGEGLMQQADAKGARYEQAMRAHPAVKEVRRAGLLMAVEFGDAALCERVVQRAVETGLLTEWFLFWPTALRIAPPLTITDDEIDASCRILLDAIDHAVARAGGR